MENPRFYQCTNPLCRLRFPAQLSRRRINACPRCGSAVEPVPTIQDVQNANPRLNIEGLPVIDAVLDNIRSSFNVGAMFRTADGAGLRQLYLCGITPLPTHHKVAKVALGAEYAVEWSYHPNSVEVVQELKAGGSRILALEIGPGAVSIFDAAIKFHEGPIVLVIGSEVDGIDPGILSLCDQTVWIPMLGFKRSLNAAVAFSIAVYTLRFISAVDPKPIDPGGQSG